MKTRRHTFTAVLGQAALFGVTALLGCDGESSLSDPDNWEFPTWQTKEDALGEGLTRTDDINARVFQGFNAVTDGSVGEECVLPKSGPISFAQFRAGSSTSEETLKYIESLDELQTSLQLDAKAQVKAGPLGVKASTSITKEFASSETSLSILLRSTAAYSVINQDNLELTDTARELATSDPAAFVRKCGTHFVSGVEYGAELRLLITIETNSVEEKERIRTELEAEGIQAGAATIDAGISTELSEVLKEEGVTVTARAETYGFQTSVSMTAVEKSPLDPSAMATARKAVEEMKQSVARDMCNDQGEAAPGGVCDGNPALGYLANGSRSARPTGVELRAYRAAANFPDDIASIDAFLEQRRLAENAVAYIEDHARAYNKLLRTYNEEIGGLLRSPTKYDYAVYNPDEVFEWVPQEELRKYAETMANGFDPDEGTGVSIIEDSLRECWDRAESGDFSGCQAEPKRLDGLQALFDSYQTMRIRPIYYSVLPEALEWQDAQPECAPGTRLPDKFEATRLFTAITGNPNVPQPEHADTVDAPWAIWVGDKFGDCDEGLLLELSNNGGETFCYKNPALDWDMELPAFCIPNAGPYGSEVPSL
ncbi:MAG: hypothetical protein AAF721_12210 [Myxococcota bacterium]